MSQTNSQIGAILDVNLGFRFTVSIDGVNYAAFTECQLPSLSLETDEVKEGGQNAYSHKLAKRVNAGTVTLRHGISKNRELLNWYLQIMQGNVETASRDISIIVINGSHQVIMTFTFRNAIPVKWSGPSLKAGDGAVALEELELAYHGFEVSIT